MISHREEQNVKIGFIGLGIMGSRMAANLQKQGHELIVYNRTKAKADALLEKGATWANSPAEVGRQVKMLLTMLANPEAVAQMALGEAGFLPELAPGSYWVDCSTVHPSFSRQMAEEAYRRRVHFVDAPVAGTKGPAERGELLFLIGGEKGDVETCRPLFDAMGRKAIHVGGNGMGTSLKMIFNLLLGESMVAFSEAMVLGQALGIEKYRLLDALLGSAIVAPFLNGKRTKIEADEWEAEFPLRWMRKDLQLASITGYEEGVPLPGVNAAKEVFGLAIGDGFADKDFSALYQFLAEKAGVTERPGSNTRTPQVPERKDK
jgi:3-hydroxyisobutyrate dehydrogenase-like beta-hydroxyacid dehydrogenase